MAHRLTPEVGQWYGHLDKGQKFEVVAYDPDERAVEVQYFDGSVEEYDLEEWFELDIETVAAPENWTGPLDDVEPDELEDQGSDLEPGQLDEEASEFRTEPGRRVPPGPGEPSSEPGEEGEEG